MTYKVHHTFRNYRTSTPHRFSRRRRFSRFAQGLRQLEVSGISEHGYFDVFSTSDDDPIADEVPFIVEFLSNEYFDEERGYRGEIEEMKKEFFKVSWFDNPSNSRELTLITDSNGEIDEDSEERFIEGLDKIAQKEGYEIVRM